MGQDKHDTKELMPKLIKHPLEDSYLGALNAKRDLPFEERHLQGLYAVFQLGRSNRDVDIDEARFAADPDPIATMIKGLPGEIKDDVDALRIHFNRKVTDNWLFRFLSDQWIFVDEDGGQTRYCAVKEGVVPNTSIRWERIPSTIVGLLGWQIYRAPVIDSR